MQLGMEIEKDSFNYTISMDGDSQWQQVVLSPSDFRNKNGDTLKDWNDVDIVISLPRDWSWQDLKVRNLTWLNSGEEGDNVR